MIFMTILMISVPTFYYLIFILHTAASWWLPIACMYILYLGTYLSNMYVLVRCNLTDPGVMPGIKSDKVDPKKKYYVVYKDSPNQGRPLTAQEFYDNNHFELVDYEAKIVGMTGAVKNEFDSRVTLLAYCTTCQILRPPRSFHCHTCNACIEVHDHHCPWVGTCVAKRNHRYFCLFLLATSIHSFATFLISISSMLRVGGSIFYDPNGQDP